MDIRGSLESVILEFQRDGLLLESDPHLPSITHLVAGEAIRGSWWGHAKGREIWRVLNEFVERKDVLITRLVSGKVTFVHRTLWPDLLGIASSEEGWQTRGLSTDGKRLFLLVKKRGTIRTDELTQGSHFSGKIGDTVRELERRLLIHSEEVHTEKGSHAKVLRSWSSWSQMSNLQSIRTDPAEAKGRFEAILRRLNEKYRGNGRLPWSAS